MNPSIALCVLLFAAIAALATMVIRNRRPR
jgi:hypothetical protein